ncbi:hypothetical protein [Dysgonomonas sp. 520]|uniref:hypothetical protein n=1 Tax=Dysgonomonas sp. 520 TaxID=2302931 RepID=UPI0016235A4D|nr:hypothetical protein [Dysgonomonas sp. 520]NDW11244.1 phage portal protein [Dysgonomonas sp. 520]
MAKKAINNTKLSYTTVKLTDNVPTYPTFKVDTSKGYVKFGKDNKFPQFILELNAASSVNSSIIKSKITYSCGAGVESTNNKYVGQPNLYEDWNTFFEKIFTDYIIFGSFSFQIILNEDNKSVSLYHQDYSTVRCGEYNEFGSITEYFISNDFSKSNVQPIILPSWGSETPTKGQPYLYVYNSYMPNLPYYSLPDWYGAINYVDADGLLSKFYNNAINNNFTPSSIFLMPSDPSDEEKEAFQRNLNNTYSGVDSANNILVLWNQSIENQMKIEKFQASDNADLYNAVNDIIMQKIMTAHRLSSPTLAGVSGSGNLSGNANEIINSYVLFSYTVIQNYRNKVLNVINQFVKRNYDSELTIIDLPIVEKIRELEQQKDDEEIIEEINDNINE